MIEICWDKSRKEGNGAKEKEFVLIRHVSEEIQLVFSLPKQKTKFSSNFRNHVSRTILGLPSSATGKANTVRSFNEVGLRSIEGSYTQITTWRDENSNAVVLHMTESLILSINNLVFWSELTKIGST